MTEPRTVTDGDNLVWSCVQAYAGLISPPEDEPVIVVCTPSGGAQSVRVELPADWTQEVSDTDLLAAIERARADST